MTQINSSNAETALAAAVRSDAQTTDVKHSSSEKQVEPVPTTEYVRVEVEDRTKRGEDAVELTRQTISPERLADLVHRLQEAMPATDNALQFRIDDILGRPVVSVIDENSGEIIRQLPSDEVVRAAHNIEYMRGVLFDNRF